MTKNSSPTYTGKVVKKGTDGKEELIGYISLWKYVPKESQGNAE